MGNSILDILARGLFMGVFIAFWLISGCAEKEASTAPELSCRAIEVLDPEVLPIRSDTVSPYYPYEARRDGLEGDVSIAVWIGPDSLVCDTEIIETIGCECFESCVESAVYSSRYEAGQNEGVSVVSRMDLVYRFRIQE